ncbi:hypothetical protein SEA_MUFFINTHECAT_23 [Microbacterium phage MuffinTheCat]|nr:hypothetical protein SEA_MUFFINTHECAT_23 [Microbacterium phage MuffinTheCat]
MFPDTEIVTVATDDETVTDALEALSDRELALYTARNIAEAVKLIQSAVETLGPLLDSPKFKLLTKIL